MPRNTQVRGITYKNQEYAKDKAWEFGNSHQGVPKVFQAQEYIFGKQHFRMRRCSASVDVIITDCPLFLGLVYMPTDFELPSMKNVIREAYDMYDNLDVFLIRNKPYNPNGRFQDEESAKGLDVKVKSMLTQQNVEFSIVNSGRDSVTDIIVKMKERGWAQDIDI